MLIFTGRVLMYVLSLLSFAALTHIQKYSLMSGDRTRCYTSMFFCVVFTWRALPRIGSMFFRSILHPVTDQVGSCLRLLVGNDNCMVVDLRNSRRGSVAREGDRTTEVRRNKINVVRSVTYRALPCRRHVTARGGHFRLLLMSDNNGLRTVI